MTESSEPSPLLTAPAAAGRCAVHAERAALGNCRRCGDFLCPECVGFDSGAGYFCARCAHREDPLVRRGRRITIGVAIAAFASIVVTVALQANAGRIGPGHLMRVALWGWVCWNLCKGRAWARKTFLVLVVLATVVTIASPLRPGFAMDRVVDAAVYGVFAALIAFPRSVKAFFAAPRPFSDALRG